MKRSEQIKFVRELSNRIRDDVVAQIKAGKILMEWDGHELRTLLRDRHEMSASMSKRSMRGKRGKVFRNHCLIANL